LQAVPNATITIIYHLPLPPSFRPSSTCPTLCNNYHHPSQSSATSPTISPTSSNYCSLNSYLVSSYHYLISSFDHELCHNSYLQHTTSDASQNRCTLWAN
ncbi:hypothetical protein OTU49_014272, partial [Cherax quadricarinatus]